MLVSLVEQSDSVPYIYMNMYILCLDRFLWYWIWFSVLHSRSLVFIYFIYSSLYMGFLGGTSGKEIPTNAGDAEELMFWTVVLEKTLESPLDSQEMKPVHPKGNQSWIFIGRTGIESPIFWPPNAKSRLTGKDPDPGKDWRQEEKVETEDEMAGWHHWLNGHEFEQALGDSAGQGSFMCCSSRLPKSLTQLGDWITTTIVVKLYSNLIFRLFLPSVWKYN